MKFLKLFRSIDGLIYVTAVLTYFIGMKYWQSYLYKISGTFMDFLVPVFAIVIPSLFVFLFSLRIIHAFFQFTRLGWLISIVVLLSIIFGVPYYANKQTENVVNKQIAADFDKRDFTKKISTLGIQISEYTGDCKYDCLSALISNKNISVFQFLPDISHTYLDMNTVGVRYWIGNKNECTGKEIENRYMSSIDKNYFIKKEKCILSEKATLSSADAVTLISKTVQSSSRRFSLNPFAQPTSNIIYILYQRDDIGFKRVYQHTNVAWNELFPVLLPSYLFFTPSYKLKNGANSLSDNLGFLKKNKGIWEMGNSEWLKIVFEKKNDS